MRLRLAIFVLAVVATSGDARIVRVPAEAPSIQAGLDSLDNRDTVLVAVGTYEELLIAPAIQFWMIGELDSMSTRPFVFANHCPGSDTLPVMNVPRSSAPNIENIKFQNGPHAGAPQWFRRGIQSWADSVTMRNCIIDSTAWSYNEEPDTFGGLDRGKAFFYDCQFLNCIISGASAYTLKAHDCVFSGLDLFQISLVAAADSSAFVRCEFLGRTRNSILSLLFFGSVVEDCLFENAGQFQGSIISAGNFTGRITGNVFRNCRYSYTAILVSRDTVGDVYIERNLFENFRSSIEPQSFGVIMVDGDETVDEIGTTFIRDNTFVGNAGSVVVNEVFVVRGSAEISGNLFLEDGVNGLPAFAIVDQVWWTPWDSVLIRDNWFDNCGFAANGPARVDARHNWWGSASGPYHVSENSAGEGDTVAGELQFVPWRADSNFLGLNPTGLELAENFQLNLYPNPFNNDFRLEIAGFTSNDFEIKLFDLLGREVATLHHGKLTGGSVNFSAPPDLATGVYFVKASDKTHVETRKVVFLK